MTQGEIFIAVAQCVAKFYRMVDSMDTSGVAQVFAIDCEWNKAGQVIVGHSAIAAAISAKDPSRKTSHQIANLIVEMDGSQMTAQYMVNVYSLTEKGLQLEGILQSDDEFVVQGGRILIVNKRARLFKKQG